MNASEKNTCSKAIVQINSEYIGGYELVAFIKLQGKEELVEEFLEQALVRQACLELAISARQEETLEYIDAYRADRQLLTEETTRKWLEARQLRDEDFFRYAESQVLLDKLKDYLAEDKLEQYYTYEKSLLERAELYRIVVDDQSVAHELKALIAEGSEFYGLAKTYSQDETTRKLCGYMGTVGRKDLAPEAEELVFSSKERSVIGPLKCTGMFHIYLIEKLLPATLTEETAQLLKTKLFREWLTVKKDKSTIEWLK